MKRCQTCKEFKDLVFFSNQKSSKDGLKPRCRSCSSIMDKKHREKYKEKHKQSRKDKYDPVLNSLLGKAYREKDRDAYNAKQRESVRRNIKERIKASREYAKTEKGKNASRIATRNWREKFPDRYHAYNVVQALRNKGEFKSSPCEICGEVKSQAHHDDYSKPLDVRWLCGPHHREWHRHDRDIKRQHAQAQQ